VAVQILSPELGFHSHTPLPGCAADGGCSGFFSSELFFSDLVVARRGADLAAR